MKEGKCAALVLAAVLLSGCGAAEQTADPSAASSSGDGLAVVVSVAPTESAAGSTEIMEMGNTEELLGKLRRGELYFAFVEGYFDRTEFDSALYQTERFLAVCAANHRFACPPTALRDLLRERVLARESGSGTRDILEKHLAAQNMKMLRAKLLELKAQQHAEKISDIKGVQMKIEWGSQIRSYVFMAW